MAERKVSSQTRIQTTCLLFLAAVAGAAALYWLRPVMVPFVLALFISLGLGMIVQLLSQRLRVPHRLALPLTLCAGIAGLVALGAVISLAANQLAANAGFYSEQLSELLERVGTHLPGRLEQLPGLRGGSLNDLPVSMVGRILADTTNAILGLLSQSLVVLIFVLFLMLGSQGAQAPPLWQEVRSRTQAYILTKTLVSAATGVLTGLTLAILGVPLAMVFGLLAFLLNFIPSVGSVLATLAPLPVVIMSPEVSPPTAAAAIAIPGAIQFGLGNVVEPKLQGDALDLHPVTILLGLIFWGMLWGIVGMLLATPITAVTRILLERLEGARPLSELMAGRFPIPPPEETP